MQKFYEIKIGMHVDLTYFVDEFVVIGINALLLLDDLTRCGLLCPGLRAKTGTLSNRWSSGSLA